MRKDASITLKQVLPTFNGTYICQVRNRPDVHGNNGETVLTVVTKGQIDACCIYGINKMVDENFCMLEEIMLRLSCLFSYNISVSKPETVRLLWSFYAALELMSDCNICAFICCI